MSKNNNKIEAVISHLTSDMPVEMQKYAVDYATMGLLKYKLNYGDVAEYLKNEFEQKYSKHWCCIIYDANSGFGSYFTKEKYHYIHFSIGSVNFILFKQVGK
jgi:hypothetical protein